MTISAFGGLAGGGMGLFHPAWPAGGFFGEHERTAWAVADAVGIEG